MEKKLEELKEYLLQEINSKNFSFEDAHGNCGVFTSDIIGNQALSMSYKYFDVVTNEKYYDDNLNELKKVIIKDKIARDTVISYLKDGLNEHF